MLGKIFATLIFIVALGIGVSTLLLPRDQLINIIMFRDFFDVCLPILGTGALIKYLFRC